MQRNVLFFEENNTCHQAYRQGPCSVGNYFILPPGEKYPRCEVNPCREDALVPFNGSCHHVYQTGTPCPDDSYELTVTKENFQLKCIRTNKLAIQTQNRFRCQYDTIVEDCTPWELCRALVVKAPRIIKAPPVGCPPGSRRTFLGCKHMFS